MPGTILLDDLRSSVEDQLHQHVDDLLNQAQQVGAQAQQVIQPVAAIGQGAVQAPQIPTPDPQAVQQALYQHVDNLTQQAQQAAQPALQVLGQGQQAAGGALTELGGKAQQVQQSLFDHVDNLTQPQQQAPTGLQSLAPPPQPAQAQSSTDLAQPATFGGDQGLGGMTATPATANMPTAPGSPGPIDSSSPSAFARSIAPYAQYAAQKLGIDPTWVAAMAGSESNYGKAAGNELFGVKALPGQPGTTMLTHEGEYGGTQMNQTFAAYDSPQAAVDAWVDLIKNHYPGAVNAPDLPSFVHGLRQGGYFTAAEPEYLGIVKGISDKIGGDVQAGLQAAGLAPSGTQVAPAQQTTAQARAADLGYRDISQFGDQQLTAAEAEAACGPAAAVRFAERFGRNPTLREATDLAKTVGWTSGGGMAGLSSEQKLMSNMGIDTKIVAPDWQAYAKEAQTGNPVVISTAGHYYFADGYNPASGAFHVGRSGLDLKGGSEWMTPDQMQNLMGPAQGALFSNNPNVPAKGAATDSAATLGGSTGNIPAPITLGGQQAKPVQYVNGALQDAQGNTVADNGPTPIQSAQDVLGRAAGAVGGAVGGAASALGTAAQGALTQATAPVVLGAGQQSARDQVGQVASDVRDAAQGALGGAAQTVQQAAAPALGAAQSAVSAVAPNLGGDDAELARRRAALDQPGSATLGGVGGEASTGPPGEQTPQSVLGGVASAATGLGMPAQGTVQSPAEIRTNTEQTSQALQANNPIRDVLVVGGLSNMLIDQVVQNPLVFVPGAPLGEALTSIGTRVIADVAPNAPPILGRLAAGAINGGVQNAIYEMGRSDATPLTVGTAFLTGAGIGAGIDIAPTVIADVGRSILARVPDIADAIRPAVTDFVRSETGAVGRPRDVQALADQQAGRAVAEPASESTRMYHGTGSDFERPTGDRFDPNGLFGPGYYLTDRPEVAGGAVSRGQIGIDPATGRTSTYDPATGKFTTYVVGAGELRAPGYAQQRTNLTAADVVEVASRASDDARANRGYFGTSVAGELHDIAVRVGQGRTPASVGEQSMLAVLSRDVPNPERYVREIAPEIYARGGNVRAVDVPKNLRLLNADTTVAPADIQRVGEAIASRTADVNDARSFVVNVRSQNPQGLTGEALQTAVRNFLDVAQPEVAATEKPQAVNAVLANAGFDGITYAGGKRIPMTDAQGAPIEHQATVIFPESLDKIRNAVSGRQGGQANLPFPLNVGGAVAGGVAGNVATPENATPEERARNIALGAGAGLLGTSALTRALERRRLAPEAGGGVRPPETGFRAPVTPDDLNVRTISQQEARQLVGPAYDPSTRTTTRPPEEDPEAVTARAAAAADVPLRAATDPVAAHAEYAPNSATPLDAAVGHQATTVTGGGGSGATAPGTPLDRINAMYAEKPSGTSIVQRIADGRQAVVRALTDRGVDIADAQQRYAKELGRPLNADELMYEMSRLQPGPAAEARVQQDMGPIVKSVGNDYQALRNYVTARSNIRVADGVGTDILREQADASIPASLRDKVNATQTSLRMRQQNLDILQTASVPDDARVAAARRSVASAQRTLDRAQAAVETARQGVLDQAAQSGAEASANRMFSGGVSKADSQTAINQIQAELGPDRFAKVQQAADQLSRYGQSLRQTLVDSGVLSEDQANAMLAKYPDWVKTRILKYMDEQTGGGAGQGQRIGMSARDIHAYTVAGTSAAREDPIASMVAYTYQVERMAMKNNTFNALVKLDQGSAAPQLKAVGADFSPTAAQSTVTGFIDGAKQRYVTDNKALGQAIEGAQNTALPGFLTAWTNVFRALAASRNPAFVAGHASFTIPQYILRQTAIEGGPTALPRVLGALAQGYGDAFQGLLQGRSLGEAGPGTQQLLRGGGGQFGALSGTAEDAAKAVRQMGGIDVSKPEQALNLVKNLVTLKPVENLVNRVDYGPRVAAMRLAEARGAHPVQAIIAGRDATIDFNRGGTATKLLSQMIPFLNVGVQGPLQVARTFRDNPKAAVYTVGTLLGAPTLAAEIWNNADPQRAKDYADVPQYIKDSGIVIMLPTEAPVDSRGDRHPQFAWINTRNWTPFVAATREAASAVMGTSTHDWQQAANSMLAGALPVQAANPSDFAQKLALSAPGVQTIAQLSLNKDFYRGSDIVTNRADVGASPTSKFLTPGLQNVADMVAPGSIVRPSGVDFTIRNIGAGTAGAALSASDAALRAAGYPPAQIPRPTAAGPSETPVLGSAIGRFVRGQTGQSLQTARDTPLTSATRDILRRGGVEYQPSPVQGTVQGIPLHTDEQLQIQLVSNRLANDYITRVSQDPVWQRATPDQRQTLVSDAVANAHADAEATVLGGISRQDLLARQAAALPTRGTASAAAQQWMNP